MKAAFLVSSLSRMGAGVAQAMRSLAMGLNCRQGTQVVALGCRDRYTQEDVFLWGDTVVASFSVKGPWQFGFAPGLLDGVVKSQADLCHLAGLWMYPSVVSSRWARSTGRPLIVSPHGMLDPWAVKNSRLKKQIAWRMFEGGNLRNASCIHALNVAEARAVRASGLGNPICVIPNGVDRPSSGMPGPAPWGESFSRGRKVVLYLGRLHRKKNLVALVSGWAAALDRQKAIAGGWALVIAGWDQEGYAAQVTHAVQAAHLQDSVSVLGPMHGREKHALLGHASAFVLPSLSEGLPMTILEAWSYGLPVLMTPECNLPVGFDVGAAIPVTTDPAGIAEGLERLSSMSDEELHGMGERGKQLTLRRFSWDAIAVDMKGVYEWLLGGGTQPSCVLND